MTGFYMKCNNGLKRVIGASQIQNKVKQILQKPMVSFLWEINNTDISEIENLFPPKKINKL